MSTAATHTTHASDTTDTNHTTDSNSVAAADRSRKAAAALTTQQRMFIVKLLAAGRDLDFVAAAGEMSADTVRAVGQAYGYPNVDHLAWGVDELTKDLVAEQHQQARRARIAALPAHPSAPLPSRRGRPGRTPSAPAGRTSADPRAPRPAAMPTPVNTERRPYVAALRAGQLFTDATYQRPLDPARVRRMRAEFDTALLGIVDVSARGDGRYALVDGQHRWAAVKAQHGDQAPIACNVHTGLSVEQEAELFFQIDRSRRRLTGWDRWWARHGSAEQAVLGIERTVAAHQLRVGAATRDGSVRATKALEDVVAIDGTGLLDSTLGVLTAAWGRSAAPLDGVHIHGLALVLHHYDLQAELDPDRLIAAMQDIAPRQVKARAGQLREVRKGIMPRLVAAVMVDRYNAQPGRKAESFFLRLPAQGRTNVRRTPGQAPRRRHPHVGPPTRPPHPEHGTDHPASQRRLQRRAPHRHRTFGGGVVRPHVLDSRSSRVATTTAGERQ